MDPQNLPPWLLPAVGDALPDLIYVKDRDSRMIYLNAAIAEAIGRPAADLVGLNERDWSVNLDEADAIIEMDRSVIESGEARVAEEIYTDPHGVTHRYRSAKSPLRAPDGTIVGLTGVSSDITELHAAHERLVASEARFRTLADTLPAFIWMTDAEGRNIYTNTRYQEAMQRSAEQLLGHGWTDVVHPDDAQLLSLTWEESLRTGNPYESSFRFLFPDGSSRWFLVRGRAVRGPDGTITQWIGTCTDIDTQVRAQQELRDSEARIARSAQDLEATVQERTAELVELRKLDSIGQLTGGIAHDFNNLLTPILTALDLLHEDPAVPADTHDLVESALRSAEKARALVARLLTFARRQDLRAEVVDLARLVDEMTDLLTHSLGPTVEIVTSKAAALPHCTVDPHQMELALLNLCVNAKDALPSGGRVTISLDTHTLTADENPSLSAGRYVRLSVTDDGVGMSESVLASAVDPFFTTKESGRGTGLGLSMVHGLAAQSGGALILRSQEGVGTRAEMWLPAADRREATAKPVVAPPPALPPLQVLLVDDEELVRSSLADMMRSNGHTVVETGSARQALEWLRPDSGRSIDALVTDQLMPGMTGAELAGRALELRPDLPVLVISGYISDGPHLGDLPRLAKPFRKSDLNAALARITSRIPT